MAVYPERNPFCDEGSGPPRVSGVTFERVAIEGPSWGDVVNFEGSGPVVLHDLTLHDIKRSRSSFGNWRCKGAMGVSLRNVDRPNHEYLDDAGVLDECEVAVNGASPRRRRMPPQVPRDRGWSVEDRQIRQLPGGGEFAEYSRPAALPPAWAYES